MLKFIRDKVFGFLARPGGYNFLARLLGSSRVCRIYAAEYVRALPGQKILDIGCGTANILEYLPETRYVGFDANEKYIRFARQRFEGRGRFFCGEVGGASVEDLSAPFDIVLATAVLHHLNDQEAAELFRLGRRLLKKGGRLVTIDCCHEAGQSLAARALIAMDRGEHVRSVKQYRDLAAPYFDDIRTSIRRDLLRLPYTHVLLECR